MPVSEKNTILQGLRPDRILIVNLGGFGDVLLSLPAVRALKIKYPRSTIVLMVVQRVADLVRGYPFIDEVVVFNIDLKQLTRALAEDYKVLARLRKMSFDIGINMRTIVSAVSGKKIALLFNIISPQVTVGRDTEGRGRFFDVRIPEPHWGTRFEMEYDIETVAALGAKVKDRTIPLPVSAADRKMIAGLFKIKGIPRSCPVIGVHPGGKPSHRWPLDHFANVLDRLQDSQPCVFIASGGKEDIPLIRKLQKKTRAQIFNLAGDVPMRKLGALLRACALFITNDTGPMHVAAVLKMPLIALFGPEYFHRYDPRNIHPRAVVLCKQQNLEGPEQRENLKWLKQITPEEVFAASQRLLSSRKRDGGR